MNEISQLHKKIIENNPVAVATVGTLNDPNVIAVACVKVISENQILITDNFMKSTKKNIEKNNKVCLAAWNKKWKGCKIEGRAKYFSKGKWKDYVENMKENKGLPAKGAIIVSVNKIYDLS